VPVKKGDWVIRQGDDGDRFYIVDTGKYEVRVSKGEGPPPAGGGDVVHVYQVMMDEVDGNHWGGLRDDTC